ncbi:MULTISPECIES: Ig-like domain-containing protein [Vibrio]|uniref:chitinase n=1 Tax=Vibrio casei TaxID=673372 RepID=A0A368LPU5_9VIBR|nr:MULTISPECIES: Ig-like domain-containing protein [Vibrio]RCS73776.1 chitinase [Vibrio casei]SJN34892.1 Chitinase [Vibrio casei]HBV77330.1 chitinase [Vibrio sp.]
MKRTLLYSAVTTALLLSQQVLAQDCSTLPIWQPEQSYNGGSQVQQNDSAYQAQWWTQGNSPVDYSGPWQEWKNLGQCDATNGNQAPTLTIVSPLNQAQITEGSTITLKADASDPDGSVDYVEFFANNTSLGKVITSPYQLDWIATIGTDTITMVASDDQGKTTTNSVLISTQTTSTNIAPSVSLTSPSPQDTIQPNDNITLIASASDSDGYVAQVDFYVDNQLIATDTSEPFEHQWVATSGEHTLKATATDDKDATASSNNVTIQVDTPATGGCAELVTYSAGTAYNSGQLVQKDNQKYRCDVAGWCSSDAAWSYAPGTGQYWQDAWTGLGLCTTPPSVTLTNPQDGSVVLAGSDINVSADALDSDGTIINVEFFVNNASLGVDTQEPYSVLWTASTIGSNLIKAIATDNENNQVESLAQVTVSDQPVVTQLTSPSSGGSFGLGKNIKLVAEAMSVTGTITSVDFLVNGVVIASDTTAPYTANWTPSAIGAYTVSSSATDTQGNKSNSDSASVNVIEKSSKTHKLIGYWHNFVNPAGCPMPLSEMSDDWDIIDIAFADNDPNSTGTVHFNLFQSDIHSSCPAIDPVKFKQDMRDLQAKGKVFVLSLGGAEGTITLNTDLDEQHFISSLTELINQWGFDGLDIDLESGSGLVHGSQIQARLGRALLQIEQNIGGDLYLTMAPEHPYVQGGMVAYSGIWGAYIPIIDQVRSTLDLLHVQLYNNAGLPNPYTPGAAPEGSVDMMVASAKMLVEGFDLADGSHFAPLRDDQVAFGLPSGPQSANSGQAPIQNITNALDCVTYGTYCETVIPSKLYTNFGGVMTWSINWDKYDGFNFSKPIGEKLTEMNNIQ